MSVIAAPASVRVRRLGGCPRFGVVPGRAVPGRGRPRPSSALGLPRTSAWAWARAARIRRRPGGGFPAVRWDSTTSCDGPHSLRKPCTVAQAGRASSAPTGPSMAAPAIAAEKATAGWSSSVRAVMRGANR